MHETHQKDYDKQSDKAKLKVFKALALQTHSLQELPPLSAEQQNCSQTMTSELSVENVSHRETMSDGEIDKQEMVKKKHSHHHHHHNHSHSHKHEHTRRHGTNKHTSD